MHGILMFRPAPPAAGRGAGATDAGAGKGCRWLYGRLAGRRVYGIPRTVFAPCTAQAAMEILNYYRIDCRGRTAVIIGRSLVVGRPAAMLFLHQHATPTICHTKNGANARNRARRGYYRVCAGKMEAIGREYFREGRRSSMWESAGTRRKESSAAMWTLTRSSRS